MYVFAHLILLISIFYLVVSYLLYSKYKKSKFHLVNAGLFLVFGLFLLVNALIALANNEAQARAYYPFLTFNHFILPFIFSSLFFIKDENGNNTNITKQIFIFAPFIFMAFMDFFFPELTFDKPGNSPYGWVYMNKNESMYFFIYKIVYLSYILATIIYAISIYFSNKNRIKRIFVLFLLTTYFIPLVVYIVMTHFFRTGTNFNIPYFFFTSSITLIFISFFVQRFSVFDITPEIAIQNIMSNVPSMIFLLDQEGKIVVSNDIVKETFQTTEYDLHKMDFLKYVADNTSIDTMVLETSQSKGLRTEIKVADSIKIPVLLSATRIERNKQLLGFLVVANDLTNVQRLSDEKRLFDLEIKTLQSQMNPHFIFNSLNSIGHLIIKNNKQLANKYLVRLSSLFRLILKQTERKFITIEEEISNLRNYIELELLRLDHEIDYDIIMEGSDDIYFYEIPPMILQPLVENAIWHGLSRKKGAKTLKIIFRENNKDLIISVIDNGIGIKKTNMLTYNEKHNGKSLKNIKERMLLYNKYNDKFRVEFNIYDNSVEADRSGTTATFVFKNI